jgi:hypothetical protein
MFDGHPLALAGIFLAFTFAVKAKKLIRLGE